MGGGSHGPYELFLGRLLPSFMGTSTIGGELALYPGPTNARQFGSHGLYWMVLEMLYYSVTWAVLLLSSQTSSRLCCEIRESHLVLAKIRPPACVEGFQRHQTNFRFASTLFAPLQSSYPTQTMACANPSISGLKAYLQQAVNIITAKSSHDFGTQRLH